MAPFTGAFLLANALLPFMPPAIKTITGIFGLVDGSGGKGRQPKFKDKNCKLELMITALPIMPPVCRT
jgi:hypothetical protein